MPTTEQLLEARFLELLEEARAVRETLSHLRSTRRHWEAWRCEVCGGSGEPNTTLLDETACMTCAEEETNGR